MGGMLSRAPRDGILSRKMEIGKWKLERGNCGEEANGLSLGCAANSRFRASLGMTGLLIWRQEVASVELTEIKAELYERVSGGKDWRRCRGGFFVLWRR